ncbi:alpha/beta fold hydrolase [Ralstonia solanacearum]|uniref:alpha/beta fold hydrolase n=1 Tax=Ralstonia solanacearum TaxID=305 RepID=UPI0006DD34F2|nr:alpha/beta fold hydrolase [Ralstonia solanacearum]
MKPPATAATAAPLAAPAGEILAGPPRANLLNVLRAMMRPGRLGLRSLPRDMLIARYAKPQSRYLPLMGTRVHYTDEGAAHADGTLLLIHGFGASLHTWDGVLPQLARRWRVIRLDLPPFGITGPPRDAEGRPRTMALPLYRDFIDAFVDSLGLHRLSLIGNSLGGMIAWDYAARHADRVDGLVLIDSAGFPMKLPVYIDLFNHLGVRLTSPWMLPEGILRAATRDVYGDPARVSEPTLRRYADFFYAEGARQAIGRMVPTSHFDDVDTSALAAVRAPTLVLWGQRDRWIPPAHAAELARRVPGAVLRMYPALGHIPMEEDPVRVGADLCAFLDQGRAASRLAETAIQETRP